ncbi:MAG: uracil permease [Methanoregula sp.]|nr:uracil permease [Methanoregula sp.]
MQVVQVNERPPLPILATLSVQHLLAMFGATVLLPVLLGVDPATILLFNGIGTLIFLVLCQGKVPAYLGSSFAYLPPALIIIPAYGYGAALGGFIASGIMFILLGMLIGKTGIGWVPVVFPDAAMGAIVTIIGLELAPMAATMAGLTTTSPDLVTLGIVTVTLAVMIVGMTACRGFLRIIPVLLGIVAGCATSVLLGRAVLDPVLAAPWFSVPTLYTPAFSLAATVIVVPASIVTFVELIGHLRVTGTIVGRDLMTDPGIARPLYGKGISTVLSGFFGSTPNTTYAENIGVMAITRVYSVYVLAGTALIAIAISFCGKIPAVIRAIPSSVMGAVALFLFGVIAASGLRMLIDARTDLSQSRNLILVSLILVLGVSGAVVNIGIAELKGMALSAVVAIVLGVFFFVVDRMGWGRGG